MLKKKINLLCYNKNYIKSNSLFLLPFFIFKSFFMYNGRKYEPFVVSSKFLLFLHIAQFVSSTRFGRIHTVAKKKSLPKKKK